MDISTIIGDVTVTQWIAVAMAVVVGYLQKDKLGKIIRKIADVLDPLTPVPGPTPTPTPSPTPLPVADWLAELVKLIGLFKLAGNVEGEAKAKALAAALLDNPPTEAKS